ncbi:MAG TPA: MFS transporter [Vicinamibacterales bacterium]|nr:MFS transporter [Vicinamibacterales bacterium]
MSVTATKPLDVRATSSSGVLAWLGEGTPAARRSLLAASLGWMLDGFDIMLYALVVSALLRELSITTGVAGLLGSLTLVASGIGGIVFGIIADRYGRRRALIGSVLVYSIFTAACGFAQSTWQLGVFRFLLGLGMGGEWTSGAAMVSETWPDRHRGKAVALMQSAWAVGYAAAALVVAVVLPRFGWRVVFMIGILPALLTLWIRRGVEESEVWLQSRARGDHRRATIADVFRGQFASTTALLTLLSTSTIFAYWGLNLWVPAYLSLDPARGGLGLSTALTTLLVVTMQAGTFLGYVSFGYVGDAIGRRPAFVTYILVAAFVTLLYGITTNPWILLVLGPIVAFFGTGFFSGFAAVTAEIYPTSIRAVAQGFTFNVGRLGSAVAPFVVGSLAQTQGFGVAFSMLAGALLVGAATWIWLPETRGRSVTG